MASEMAMPGQEPKKGMSKGCMVALIVVGVLVVLVIVIGVVLYLKKDDLMRASARVLVNPIQHELMDRPVDGVDTMVVNRIADAFLTRIDSTEFDLERFGYFAQTVQTIMADKVIDAEEAEMFVQGMINYYPELEDLLPEDEFEGAEEGWDEEADTVGISDN